jgi:CMP-N-acetylneuraminic acid synthetase
MTNIAIIPARGGSKGLKHKNIIDLNGKPLIIYTIEAALKSGIFDQVIVTTDDELIESVCESSGVQVIKRPSSLAQDYSSSLDVVQHALTFLGLNEGVFCLLQPTSPLRNAQHIIEAFEIYQDRDTTSVISAAELEHHPYKCLVENNEGGFSPVHELVDLVSPRQKLPSAIAPNGAIYFCNIHEFLLANEIFYQDTQFYLMSAEDSVDIDNSRDLDQAAIYLARKGSIS